MKAADAAIAQNLVCVYWGSDAGREFDILADGKKIATEILNNSKPNQFIYKEYKIPAEIIHNKNSVTITFQAHKAGTAGGLFGCRIVKAK